MPRKVNLIILHCSATPEGRVVTAADIDRMHKERGFAKIGYHRFIRLDGTIERGRGDETPGAHAQGHNSYSIGICYAGGVDAAMKPKDTRTPAQKASLRKLVDEYLAKYPGAKVLGHCDLPGVNKACPSFDTAKWLQETSQAVSYKQCK